MGLSAYFFWNWLHYVLVFMIPITTISSLFEKPASHRVMLLSGSLTAIFVGIISVIAETFHNIRDPAISTNALLFGLINIGIALVTLHVELYKLNKENQVPQNSPTEPTSSNFT